MAIPGLLLMPGANPTHMQPDLIPCMHTPAPYSLWPPLTLDRGFVPRGRYQGALYSAVLIIFDFKTALNFKMVGGAVWRCSVVALAWAGVGTTGIGTPALVALAWLGLIFEYCQLLYSLSWRLDGSTLRSGVKGPREGDRVREGRWQGAAPNGYVTRVTYAC